MSGRKIRDWSNLIVTIATVVFACTALITVFITISSWRAEREAARPYLTFKDSPLVNLHDGVNFELKFNNVGEHPVTGLWSRAIVMEQALKAKPVFDQQHALVNDIPKDTSTSLVINLDQAVLNPNQKNIPPYYIVVLLKYQDPIIRKIYTQAMYLKWNGINNGGLESIYHLEVNEKDSILKYFKENNIRLPD